MVLRPTPIKLFVPESMQKRFHPYQYPPQVQRNAGNFLGNLSNVLLGVNPLCRPTYGLKSTYRHDAKPMQHESPHIPPQNWRFAMPMQGFKCEHVKVTVQDGNVRVEARRTDGEEGNSRSYGMSRTITLPYTVDVTKLTTHLSDRGFLIIEVPYKTANLMTSSSTSATGETQSINQGKNIEELGGKKEVLQNINEEQMKSIPEGEVEIGEISKLVKKENKDELSESTQLGEGGSNTAGAKITKEGDSSSEEQSEQPSVLPKTDSSTPRQNLYRLSLNLGSYSPENIRISLEGTSLFVQAENKDASGYTCKFARRYFLPGNLDLSCLKCRRDPRGVMNISAPYRQ